MIWEQPPQGISVAPTDRLKRALEEGDTRRREKSCSARGLVAGKGAMAPARVNGRSAPDLHILRPRLG